MMRSTFLYVGLIAIASATDVAAAEFDPAPVDALVRDALIKWQVPGAAVVIVEGNRVLYLKGHGVREHDKKEPIIPDTIFPLASCSKAFTTTLMAMLVDDDKLSWDDPVRKHLKDFHLSAPHADALVTLRDLVSHRTGVAAHDLLWYRAAWNQEEMIRRVGKLPLSMPFRGGMQYQSIMFTAAGHAAAKAGEKPWHSLIQERILDPLEMKSASCSTRKAMKNADLASGHRPEANGKPRVVPWYLQDEPNPAGSINASARDLANWLRFHLTLGEHGDSRFVSAKSLKATHTPQVPIPVVGETAEQHPETQMMAYGMGWVIQDYRGEMLVSHAGIIDGFRIHLTLVPKRKFAIAILCNMHATRMNLALNNQLVDRLLNHKSNRDWNQHYLGLEANEQQGRKAYERRLEQNRRAKTKPTLVLEQYVGEYEDPAYGVSRIRREKDDLIWEWSNFRYRLEHYHDDTYRVREEILHDPMLEFRIDEGKLKGLEILGVQFQRR